jgi:hypothetical protein
MAGMLPRERAWPSRSAARWPVRATSTAASCRPLKPSISDSHWYEVRVVADGLGEAPGLGELAPRQLGVAGRAVEHVVQHEHGEYEQSGRPEPVVVDLVGQLQRLLYDRARP